MKGISTHLWLILIGVGFIFPTPAPGYSVQLTLNDKVTALSLARSIAQVHPYLPKRKRLRYSLAIVKAAKYYRVDPVLLAAMAYQESSFRENLGRGPAGEYGIAQICEHWLRKPDFVKRFGHRKPADLNNPFKAFHYMAWILSTLKNSVKSKTLPYWTHYNSKSYVHRLAYSRKVQRHLDRLEGPFRQNRKKISAIVARKRKKQLRLAYAY